MLEPVTIFSEGRRRQLAKPHRRGLGCIDDCGVGWWWWQHVFLHGGRTRLPRQSVPMVDNEVADGGHP